MNINTTTILWWLIQNAITVAILIPLVMLLCRAFRHRPSIQHALWTLVLLKFLTPPLVFWPWSAQDLAQWVWSPVKVESPREMSSVDIPLDVFVAQDPTLTVSADLAPLSSWDWLVSQQTLLIQGVFGVWLAGCVFCLVKQSRRVSRHASLVNRGKTASNLLTREIQAIAKPMGLQPPCTLVANEIISPFVWCLGKLRLIWPESLSSLEEIARSRGVIAHELAHVRRRDHWVAWLEMAAQVLWWWNPLLGFVRNRMRESAEMACDALAIAAFPDSRCQYAERLLELSADFSQPHKSGTLAPVLAVSASAPSSFERRLTMILSDQVSGKTSFPGFLAVLCLAIAILPGWSWGQQQEQQPKQPAAESKSDLDSGLDSSNAHADEFFIYAEIPTAAQDKTDNFIDLYFGPLAEETIKLSPQDTKARNIDRIELRENSVYEYVIGREGQDKKDAHIELHAAHPHLRSLDLKSCAKCHQTTEDQLLKFSARAEDRVKIMEAEIKRLKEQIAHQKKAKAQILGDLFVVERQTQTKPSPWTYAKLNGLFFEGRERTYSMDKDENGVYLSAINPQGRKLWRSRIEADSENLKEINSTLKLAESQDGKVVQLTWNTATRLTQYQCDAATGRFLTKNFTGLKKAQSSSSPQTTDTFPVKIKTPAQPDSSDKARLERLEKGFEELHKQIKAFHFKTSTQDNRDQISNLISDLHAVTDQNQTPKKETPKAK